MGDKTTIAWTGGTWNPVRARNRETGKVGWFCIKISPGCANCYADDFNRWIGNRVRYIGKRQAKVELFLDENLLAAPLRRKKPTTYFLSSTTDIFADFVPDEWLDRMFAVMAICPQHTFQVLTKRSARLRQYIESRSRDNAEAVRVMLTAHRAPPGKWCEQIAWPLPNVWFGVSVEDQKRADERLPDLLAVKARLPGCIVFLSMEPLLEAVDLTSIQRPYDDWMIPYDALDGRWHEKDGFSAGYASERIDLVILGLESGPHSRVGDLANVRAALRRCQAAGVATFVKQLGRQCRMSRADAAQAVALGAGWEADEPGADFGVVSFVHPKGSDPNEWPEDLRVQQMPVTAQAEA